MTIASSDSTEARKRIRIGLVGTGYWADRCHAEGIDHNEDLEFVGVWGRNSEKAAALAERHSTQAFGSAEALFEAVDAVSFAVPPEVQASLAPSAAAAGRHLLLEKPITTSDENARVLIEACQKHRVQSVVNFSLLHGGTTASWIREVVSPGNWDGGNATLLGDLRVSDSPFSESPWRLLDNGALWDVGPHALSLLVAGLGPVDDVRGQHGRGDSIVLALRHRSGAVSTVTLSYSLGAGAREFSVDFWGADGLTTVPPSQPEENESHLGAIGPALSGLVRAIRTGEPNPYDVRFGAEIVRILARADEITQAR